MSPALVLVALVVGACGGGGSDDPPSPPLGQEDREGLEVRFPVDADPDALTSPWLAVVDVFQNASVPSETGEVSVNLVRYTPELAFRTHVDFYAEEELDTCTIDEPDDTGDEGDEDEIDPSKRSVNGGDALTLSSAGGTWISVPYSRERIGYFYDPDEEGFSGFSGPVPADLTLSLSGAEFPAVDALPIGVPDAPLRLSPPIDEAIGPATEYRWTPGDDGAIVRVVFKNFVGGDFQGFPVRCRARDDGAFELPEDALAALAALPGETTVRYSRELERVEFRDGITVFQSVDIVDD